MQLMFWKPKSSTWKLLHMTL